ncbi:MAG: hypothetical protein NWF00_09570 [Candidatus Bathyarchaeota archaeon]|nr:hypothetical protein [Candidatus Bathyarchaeota archaeon]
MAAEAGSIVTEALVRFMCGCVESEVRVLAGWLVKGKRFYRGKAGWLKA